MRLLVILMVWSFNFDTQAKQNYKNYYQPVEQKKSKGKFFWEGQFLVDLFITKDDGHSFIVNRAEFLDSYIKLTYQSSEKLKAILRGKFQGIYDFQTDEWTTFKFADFLEDAYIIVSNVGGKPVTFVIGKQAVAYGHIVSQMPNFNNDLVNDLSYMSELFGFTFQLDVEDMKLFDKMEISVFENQNNDLAIGDITGASIRFTKMITEKFKVTASALRRGYDDPFNNDLVEQRASIGAIYIDNDWSYWADVFAFKDVPFFPDSNKGFSAGVAKNFRKQRVSAIVESVDNYANSAGMGYDYFYNNTTTISSELRYFKYDNDAKMRYGLSDELNISLIFRKKFNVK